MPSSHTQRRNHLRLVHAAEPADAPPILTSRSARREFDALAQELVEIVIEIADLLDGDADMEPDEDGEDDSDEGA